jgi:lysophospholipase L1-like esterase
MRGAEQMPGDDARRTSPLSRWLPGGVVAAAVTSMVFAVVPAAGLASASSTTYVALGDSYTAGPLIPTQVSPLGCLKSNHDYPSDTAAALGLTLSDMSCSGATSGDMTSSQGVTPGPNPPQFSAITSTTGAVSLQIGGNDVGFTDILENCAALTPWGPTKVGQTCQSYYDPNGVDQLGATIAALEPTIASLIQQIHTLAPSAEVFVVGYPAIIPNTGGCWPSLPLETSDAQYLRTKEIQLDGVLQTAATQNGAIFVNTYPASESHNACEPESKRWIEPLFAGKLVAPVHPNARGEKAMAGMLEKAMEKVGIS